MKSRIFVENLIPLSERLKCIEKFNDADKKKKNGRSELDKIKALRHEVFRLDRTFHDAPEYLGKKYWSENGVERTAYVFLFSLWTFLECGHEEFHGFPREDIRNIGRHDELIFIMDDGQVYISTTTSLNTHRFWRCQQSAQETYRYLGYDSEEKSWRFEKMIDSETHDKEDIFSKWTGTMIHLLIMHNSFDLTAPCPPEIIEKFPFISHYSNKPFFGPNNPITESQRQTFKSLTNQTLISSRDLNTFHFRVLSENLEEMKILQIDAKWFTVKNEEFDYENGVLVIKDFPGFDYENLMKRRTVLWELTDLRGYCCGHETEFYKVIKREKILQESNDNNQ